jgi:uncharacterized protein (DUF2236 family)
VIGSPTAPEHGLFGPRSVTWQVDREIAVLIGSGSRALMLQVAHPMVAAAVAEHSRYRSDPLGRLRETLDVIYTFAFGDERDALAAVQRVNRRHQAVRGAGPDGHDYWAMDPELLLWVYATLIDSSLLAYNTFVRPLPQAERERYYAEFCHAGTVWGIPAEKFPASLAELRSWMAKLIDSGEVRVTPQGREVGRYILAPPVWWLPGLAAAPLQLITVWLLPPPIRTGFGYTWGPRRERFMHSVAALSRAVVPRLPGPVRDLPIARAAERRVRA